MISARGLNPAVKSAVEWCFEAARLNGLQPTVTSTYRSLSEQRKLYRDFLAGKSPYPANPAGQSGHNYGLAWDSWVPDAQMPLWTAIREAAGFRVPANDLIHAEVPSWPELVRRR